MGSEVRFWLSLLLLKLAMTVAGKRHRNGMALRAAALAGRDE
jgi:hypothetical protein